jgi:flagellar protein FlgJ
MNPIDTRSFRSVPAYSGAASISGNSGARRATVSSGDDPQRLDDVCKEMESLFLQQLLKEMRNTVPESGFSETGSGRKMFTEMMDEAMSKKLAEKGIGLADVLERQLRMNV